MPTAIAKQRGGSRLDLTAPGIVDPPLEAWGSTKGVPAVERAVRATTGPYAKVGSVQQASSLLVDEDDGINNYPKEADATWGNDHMGE